MILDLRFWNYDLRELELYHPFLLIQTFLTPNDKQRILNIEVKAFDPLTFNP